MKMNINKINIPSNSKKKTIQNKGKSKLVATACPSLKTPKQSFTLSISRHCSRCELICSEHFLTQTSCSWSPNAFSLFA